MVTHLPVREAMFYTKNALLGSMNGRSYLW
jgi:hypothetical protein